MRTTTIATVVAALLIAVARLEAQTVPVTPTSIDIHLMPATGDPLAVNVLPVASRSTVIATVAGGVVTPNANCGKDPFVGPVQTQVTNPVRAEVPDPFDATRRCWADVPTGPNGTGYRMVATLVATSCQPAGFPLPVSPCPSARTVATDDQGNHQLFTLAPIPDRPVAPTRLVVRP